MSMQRDGGLAFQAQGKPCVLAWRMKEYKEIENNQWFGVARCN